MAKYPRKLRRVFYKADDVSQDTFVILLDVSDATNYNWPSDMTSYVVLGIDIATEKASDGRYDIHVGPVKENDGTDGTMQYLKSWFLDADGNSTDGTDRFVDEVSFCYPETRLEHQGIECSVVSNATEYLVGTASGNQTSLQDDATDLASARGGSSLAAADGDLMLFIDETSDSGTISVAIGVDYYVV